MKVTVTFEFGSEAEAVAYLTEGPATAKVVANRETFAGNALAASPAPAGRPVPAPSVPQSAPPASAPLPTPSPMPPPAPANNGGGSVTIQAVMGAMQEYAKQHKAAGIKNVLSHVGISKITEANPEQLLWLKGVFDLNQPMAAAS